MQTKTRFLNNFIYFYFILKKSYKILFVWSVCVSNLLFFVVWRSSFKTDAFQTCTDKLSPLSKNKPRLEFQLQFINHPRLCTFEPAQSMLYTDTPFITKSLHHHNKHFELENILSRDRKHECIGQSFSNSRCKWYPKFFSDNYFLSIKKWIIICQHLLNIHILHLSLRKVRIFVLYSFKLFEWTHTLFNIFFPNWLVDVCDKTNCVFIEHCSNHFLVQSSKCNEQLA